MAKVKKKVSSLKRWSIPCPPQSARTLPHRRFAAVTFRQQRGTNAKRDGTLTVEPERFRRLRSLIRCHNVRYRAFELLCGGALPHHAAEGGIARHFGIAPAPRHPSF